MRTSGDKMKNREIGTAALAFCLGLFCTGAAPAEDVKFRTGDGCLIAASYRAPAKGKRVFVNIHGLGSNRGEWGAFEKFLKTRGYGWLSLDLRGHGQSLECAGKKADYRVFGAGEWNAAVNDIAAARDYLKARKVPSSKTVLCGASIGANLALKAAAERGPAPAEVVMLSPGLVYAGVGIEEYFNGPLAFPLFLAASPDDPYAWQSSLRLFEAAGTQKLKAAFRQGFSGHGVGMFSGAGASLMGEIVDITPK
jgi:alpha-beta hydrolase superfamily lysophospholipase